MSGPEAAEAEPGDEARLPPPALSLRLDPGLRRRQGGTVLIGGYPLRILRLTATGAASVDAWAAGAPVGPSRPSRRLARRLLDAGMAHPPPAWPPGTASAGGEPAVTVVVPTSGRTEGLERLLSSLRGVSGSVLVVDDGSPEPAAVASVAGRHGARVLRRDSRGGPAAARNAGWRSALTDVVAFLDDDCQLDHGWASFAALITHLRDPAVAAVAPRVLSLPGRAPAWLAAYEATHGTLDLGARPAPVRPGSPVPFVPGAALVVRRRALEDLGGFDETMPLGEDVDLVWRLGESGWTVRYDPSVTLGHETRPDLADWLRQRFRYGTSAAPLDLRHPGSVPPLAVSGWTALAWGLVGTGTAGGAAAGAALALGTTAALAPRLPLERPFREALDLAGRGHLRAGGLMLDAARRVWWPLLVPYALSGRRRRRLALLALIGPPAWQVARGAHLEDGGGVPRDGTGQRSDQEAGPTVRPWWPVAWMALRTADDLSYGAGVWWGALAGRRAGPLLPQLHSWPGRGPAVGQAGDAPVAEAQST